MVNTMRQKKEFKKASEYWRDLKSDEGAHFDKTIEIDVPIEPMITWGTSPEMAVAVDDKLPDLDDERFISKRDDLVNAFSYMGLKQNVNSIELDKIFIGSYKFKD